MRVLIRLFLPILLLLAAVGSASAADQSFVWERIATDVVVSDQGTLAVTEQLTLRYTGGPFTFAFRDLPDRRLDAIANVSISDGERSYRAVDDEESKQPFTYSVFREDGNQRVRWVYPETSDTSRTFTLRYEVTGAVRRYANHDEIWWSVVFPNRDEEVESATGAIRLPQPVPGDQLSAETPDIAGQITLQPGVAQVQASGIQPDDELTLRLQFPKNIVGGIAPAWQAQADWQDNYNATLRPTVNVALSLLSALLLAATGAGAWLWARGRREPVSSFDGAVYAPPDSLRPAEVARLLGETENQAFLGTLFDLANRGFMTFHEEKHGWQGSVARAVRTHHDTAGLQPGEQRVLEALFAKGESVELSGSNSQIINALPKLGEASEAQLVTLGLVDPARRDERKQAYSIGTVLLVVGLTALIVSLFFAQRYSVWLPVAAAALALGGLSWMLAGASIRGLTQQGVEAAARWRAFKHYLAKLDNGQGPLGQFGQLLPYAVAIGDVKTLTRSYATTREPLPIWYYPYFGGMNGGGMNGGGTGAGFDGGLLLQDFGQNFLSAVTTAGQSTSSSGGGASGGGASGGGGGGAG